MRPGCMKVNVLWNAWDVEGGELRTTEELSAMNFNEIENYLHSGYRYAVKSFEIVDLDSGKWNGEHAWLLSCDNNGIMILVGDYSIVEALEAKIHNDNKVGSKYDKSIICVTVEDWFDQQYFSCPKSCPKICK